MKTLIALALVLACALPAAAEPDVVRRTLDNGVLVQVSQQTSVPAVIVNAYIRAGSRLDPSGKEGLANLTADLLNEGTENRSAREISEAIDFIGASLSTSAAHDYAVAGLTVLRKDLEVGLDLLSDSLLRPTFPREEIKRRKESILGSIRSSEDNPGSVAQRAFHRAVYGSGPYGHPVEGLYETVEGLTREDVHDFYSRWYRPQRAVVTVVGDVDPEVAVSLLRARLGGWKAGTEELQGSSRDGVPTREVIVIDKPVTQANIILGHTGVARSNSDYYALVVMNQILGGGAFASRLFDSIRTEAGLAYSVSSFFSVNELPGSFQVVMQTKNMSAAEAVERARTEIRRIRDELVTKRELEDAQRYLTGSFPLRLDSNREIADFVAQVEFFGLGDDYAARYDDLINSVTREEVRRVAREYLRPDELILVVVGRGGEIDLPGGAAPGS